MANKAHVITIKSNGVTISKSEFEKLEEVVALLSKGGASVTVSGFTVDYSGNEVSEEEALGIVQE